MPAKNIVFSVVLFFCLLLFEGVFTSVFKDESQKEFTHKIAEIIAKILTDPGLGSPKIYRSKFTTMLLGIHKLSFCAKSLNSDG